ncbi:MAG: LPS export ABC transporter periplasmic protein LptC [Candidatus Cloacimonadaceae bacterium]
MAWLMLAFACKSQDLNQKFDTLDRNLPDESSLDVKIVEFDGDKVDYELSAKRIDRFYDRRILNAISASLTSYNHDTGGVSYLQADSTIVDDARNMVFAYGNVRLSSPSGTVQSASMTWDRNMDQIIAPGQVVLTKNGNTLRGNHLRTNSNIDYAQMETVSADGIFDASDFDW